ncbi:TetR/AcrR family transcriptional regulator [Persicobacter diffluens]|uniref:HTH tetR-type domain-containing protein n=1 Tax=Persicobacter diffluens TaxID=981 RepID=A0AAN5ALC4_9BACT|nr:hypothetical protein PEDI_32490 [Persicobacter diffluens]
MKEDVKGKILKVATNILLEKGYSGLKMQALADEAQINKGLLHYYFKNKQNIYYGVLEILVDNIYLHIRSVLDLDIPFEERLAKIALLYLDRLEKIPGLPTFIVGEICRNPELANNFPLAQEFVSTLIFLSEKLGEAHLPNGREEVMSLITNMMSLLAFPYMMDPLKQKIFPQSHKGLSEEGQKEQRAKEVAAMVMFNLKSKA